MAEELVPALAPLSHPDGATARTTQAAAVHKSLTIHHIPFDRGKRPAEKDEYGTGNGNGNAERRELLADGERIPSLSSQPALAVRDERRYHSAFQFPFSVPYSSFSTDSSLPHPA